MKRIFTVAILVVLYFVPLSCSKQATYTVTPAHDKGIIVAAEKEMMEYMIDCSITRGCPRLNVMNLLYQRKLLFLDAGTRVELADGLFSWSDAKRIHILTGQHRGQSCWVYNRMLYQDRAAMPYQLAFARFTSPM